MDGPAHYRDAEKLVTVAAGLNGDAPVREYLAAAQVHATLALAAATAFATTSEYIDTAEDAHAWDTATGVKPP